MTRNKSRGLLAATALWLGLAGNASASPPADGGDRMPASPALREGTLPNGLRYALLPNRNVPGHVSVRLIVRTGSLDERDDERGYAHFVEHMAFEGTTHYPSGRLVLFLQRLGLGFGADLNADTSFTHTIYKLDLPAVRFLPEALGVLRDYADGLAFPDYALQRQRGVILSELHARDTANYELTKQWIGALYAGAGLPGRMPMGDEALIGGADAGKLRAYYRRCYRPERMIVLVVGDFDANALEPAMRTLFGSVAASGPLFPPAAVVLPPTRAMSVDVIASPVETSAAADLISIVPVDDGTRAGFHTWLSDIVVVDLLNRRLAEDARGDPRVGNAFAVAETGPDQLYTHFRVEVQAAADDWRYAVARLEHEMRSARSRTFRTDEVREACFAVLANLGGSRDEAATYQPSTLADRVSARLAAGRDWPDLDAYVEDAAAYLAHVSPEDAEDALHALYPADGAHLVVRRPAPIEGGRDAVLAAYVASSALPLAAAPPDEGRLLFRYGDALAPGAVAGRRAEPDLRLTLVTYANGVRLNLRPSAGESRRFGLDLRLGRGVADASRERPRLELLAVAMILHCDLGRNTRDEITRLLKLHAVALNFDLTDYQMTIDAAGPATELPFTLRLLAAYLSDLKLDPGMLKRAVGEYAVVRNEAVGSTASLANVETYFRMASSDPRARLPSPQEIARYPFEEVSAWTRAHWLAGPAELGITGDIDVESTVSAVALTLGALPPRADPPSDGDRRLVLRAAPYRRTEPVNLPDRAATLRIAWPAGAAADIRVNAALQLAIDTVLDRFRIQLREELGATYSPRGGISQAPDQPDFCFAWIELTFDPRQAKRLGERALAIADELASRGITDDEFARLREPRRAQTAAQLGSNYWWARNVLSRAQSRPGILGDLRALVTVYSALTRDDVNRVAAQILPSKNATAILMMPADAQPPP